MCLNEIEIAQLNSGLNYEATRIQCLKCKHYSSYLHRGYKYKMGHCDNLKSSVAYQTLWQIDKPTITCREAEQK